MTGLIDAATGRPPVFMAVFFMMLTLLTGCSALQHKEIAGEPVALPIAPPTGPARHVVQQLTATWTDRQETLVCVLELDDRHIAMAGLTNEGLSLFNLSYDGHTLTSDKSPLLPDAVAPEFIIADLQLVYWPVAGLEKILPAGWRLEADPNGRILYHQDDKKAEVRYLSPDAAWPRDVELTNHQYHYRLDIKTLSYDVLPE
ncbi:DUF3261 domain-containing protein [Methylobacter sp. BlB1]|uniref:DUF3261 domain-containing protein n=1 Tax=Methylobacter sp. BlB1 TaxID=2785914 RepID=UPI001894DE21|nr:DUF3261 domain-containing protein [Methylobacter sp. BlB1]MBF6649970.1 DUF3261 domain-containing protein [Methylobacter sp. BlB1]